LNVAVAGGILLYLLKHDMPRPSSWSKLIWVHHCSLFLYALGICYMINSFSYLT
jgi:hypothetical protein